MHSIGAIATPVDILGICVMSIASPHPYFSGADTVSPLYFLKPIDTGST
jgi:hypothetical protein